MLRSACPAASARPSIYAAKRFSCGHGTFSLPTEQFYTKLFFYNTVVLEVHEAVRRRLAELNPFPARDVTQRLVDAVTESAVCSWRRNQEIEGVLIEARDQMLP